MQLSKTLGAFIASPNFFETDKVKLFVQEAMEYNLEVPYNAYVSKSTHCNFGLSKYEVVQPHFLTSNRASNDGYYNQLNVFIQMELYREEELEKVNLIGVKLALSFSEEDIQHSLRENYADGNEYASVHQTAGMLQTHRFTIPKSYTTVLTEQQVFEVIRLWVKSESDTMDDGKLTPLPRIQYSKLMDDEQIEKLISFLGEGKHSYRRTHEEWKNVFAVLQTIVELMKSQSKELRFVVANYDALTRSWYVKTLLLGRENVIEIITTVTFNVPGNTAFVRVLLLGRQEQTVVARCIKEVQIQGIEAMRNALCQINTAKYEDVENQFGNQFLNFQQQTLAEIKLKHLETY